MSTDTLKTSICDALAAFIRQRPGFEFCNYGNAASYRADSRTASLHKRDAETLLAAVRWRESITGADLIEAARGAFSGRLTIELLPAGQTVRGVFLPSPIPDAPSRVRIDYCVGQYRPTEYRAAVCAVLAGALWNWQRDNMPAPACYSVIGWGVWQAGKFTHARFGSCTDRASAEELLADSGGREAGHVQEMYSCDGRPMSAGDWLRAKFRREFGSSLARRWFN